MSTLSRSLKMSMQDAKRNLDNLLSEGLVERDSKGVFSLTTFGSMIVRQIPSMDFLSRNKEYFSDHNFGEIPDKFIHRIGELNDSKFVKGYVTVIEKIKGMYAEAEEYIYGMLPEVSLELVDTVQSSAQDNSIKFKEL
jgi:predicted transcriptional regulator